MRRSSSTADEDGTKYGDARPQGWRVGRLTADEIGTTGPTAPATRQRSRRRSSSTADESEHRRNGEPNTRRASVVLDGEVGTRRGGGGDEAAVRRSSSTADEDWNEVVVLDPGRCQASVVLDGRRGLNSPWVSTALPAAHGVGRPHGRRGLEHGACWLNDRPIARRSSSTADEDWNGSPGATPLTLACVGRPRRPTRIGTPVSPVSRASLRRRSSSTADGLELAIMPGALTVASVVLDGDEVNVAVVCLLAFADASVVLDGRRGLNTGSYTGRCSVAGVGRLDGRRGWNGSSGSAAEPVTASVVLDGRRGLERHVGAPGVARLSGVGRPRRPTDGTLSGPGGSCCWLASVVLDGRRDWNLG